MGKFTVAFEVVIAKSFICASRWLTSPCALSLDYKTTPTANLHHQKKKALQNLSKYSILANILEAQHNVL